MITQKVAGRVYREITDSIGRFSFTMSKAGTNLNFFSEAKIAVNPVANYEVYINEELTMQSYRSLTFQAGDVVDIVAKPGVESYPKFLLNTKNYVRAVNLPFPYMNDPEGGPLQSYWNLFRSCSDLVSIPEDLFVRTTEVFGFNNSFNGTSLVEIPEGLFRKQLKIEKFNCTFENCKKLISIPEHLFDNKPICVNWTQCFRNATNITGHLPELWKLERVTTYAKCYENCKKADNYAEAKAAGWAG